MRAGLVASPARTSPRIRDKVKKLLAFTAVAEAGTGAALVVAPRIVGQLLLGAELAGVAIPVARVAGIALIALGIACWPRCTALCGMLTYSALATLYLARLGIGGEWVGKLLWPAVAVHAVLTVLFAVTWFSQRKKTEAKTP